MSHLSISERLKLGADQSAFFGKSFFSFTRALSTLRSVSPRLALCLLQRRLPTPVELRQAFETMGVTYIKLGQFIGSSPSLFPEEYVEAFQDCFDRTPEHSFALIRSVIENELEQPIDAVFSRINEKPLASASIAQVHAATLKTGEPVVIKVQKPGVEATIDVDLNILLLATRIVEWLTPAVNRQMISGFVEAIFPYMIDECDFGKEEKYLIEFDRFVKEQGIRDVVIPKPYPALSTKRVLIMERLHGKTFSDWVREDKLFLNSRAGPWVSSNAEYQQFNSAVTSVKNVWFSSLFNHWFFHADLHLGNMMLLDSGEVGLIDFGLVSSIDRKIWQACQKLFHGIINSNSSEAASALFEIGMTQKKVDLDAFAKDIDKLLGQFKDMEQKAGASFGQAQSSTGFDEQAFNKDANRWLIELGKLSRNYGLIFPHAFTLLLKQFLYFDRLEDYTQSDEAIIDVMETAFADLELSLESFPG